MRPRTSSRREASTPTSDAWQPSSWWLPWSVSSSTPSESAAEPPGQTTERHDATHPFDTAASIRRTGVCQLAARPTAKRSNCRKNLGQSHVARSEFRDRRHTEELHGPSHLTSEDLSCPIDPPFAAGHEPVEVRASDQGRAGAEGSRRDDVAASHHSRVDPHFGPVADCIKDVGQDPYRNGGTIELAASVVGHHDGVGPCVDNASRIIDGLNPLDDERTVPEGPEPFEVGDRHRWVEELVRNLAESAVGGR